MCIRDRGIGAGNQHGDIGVVNPAPERLVLGLPFDPVIQGAAGEQSDRCERKNAQSDAPLELVGHGNQDQPGHKGDGGHNQVDQAPKLGLGELRPRRLGLVFRPTHLSTVAPSPRKPFGVSESGILDLAGSEAYKTRFDLSAKRELQSSSALFTTNTPDLGGREIERAVAIKRIKSCKKFRCSNEN